MSAPGRVDLDQDELVRFDDLGKVGVGGDDDPVLNGEPFLQLQDLGGRVLLGDREVDEREAQQTDEQLHVFAFCQKQKNFVPGEKKIGVFGRTFAEKKNDELFCRFVVVVIVAVAVVVGVGVGCHESSQAEGRKPPVQSTCCFRKRGFKGSAFTKFPELLVPILC